MAVKPGADGQLHGGGHLRPGGRQFRGDDGSADAGVSGALAKYWAGEGSERAALTALAQARLLVPVVATLAEPPDAAEPPNAAERGRGAEKNSEMALPTLIGRDGRPAIIAFTSVDTLARWRRDARPMPAEAARVWQAAVAAGAAVVVDVAGPVPFVVEGARLAALASGQPAPQPFEDPDIHQEIQAAIAAEPAIAGARVRPGSELGTDLSIQLLITPGGEREVSRVAEQISARLARRLSRGIEITASAAGASAAGPSAAGPS